MLSSQVHKKTPARIHTTPPNRAIGDAAFARGSGDNITALVVDLKKFASAGVSDPSAPEPPSSPSRGLHGASARKKEKLK